jgi:hypothetical protein
VTGWTAYAGVGTFQPGSKYYVNLQGNGSDVTVFWSGNATAGGFPEVTTTVRACLESNNTCVERTRTSGGDAPWTWALAGLIPVVRGLANVTVVVSAANNQTVTGGSDWTSVWADLGRNDVVAHLSYDAAAGGGFHVAVEAVPLNYTCQWTADIVDPNTNKPSTLELRAPLTIGSSVQYPDPQCVVPEFDTRLPAGTAFTMALLFGEDDVVVPPPAVPVVGRTGARATGLTLPADLCSGQNVSVEGFFFFGPNETATYACSFGRSTSAWRGPVSATLVVCPLPGFADTVTHVTVWQSRGPATSTVGGFNKTFTFTQTCGGGGGGGGGGKGNDDDAWPYWAWILVGLGAVAGLTTVMGLAALAYVQLCRGRGGGGEYEHLAYTDNPIHYGGSELPIDRKTFSA